MPLAHEFPSDDARRARSADDMAREADAYASAARAMALPRSERPSPGCRVKFSSFDLDPRQVVVGGWVPAAELVSTFTACCAPPSCRLARARPLPRRLQVFLSSPSGLSHSFVNLKPLVPGHVLVVPARVVDRYGELTATEAADLWAHVRATQRVVLAAHGATASHLGLQDGKDSGQSVPHVHVHILPAAPPRHSKL